MTNPGAMGAMVNAAAFVFAVAGCGGQERIVEAAPSNEVRSTEAESSEAESSEAESSEAESTQVRAARAERSPSAAEPSGWPADCPFEVVDASPIPPCEAWSVEETEVILTRPGYVVVSTHTGAGERVPQTAEGWDALLGTLRGARALPAHPVVVVGEEGADEAMRCAQEAARRAGFGEGDDLWSVRMCRLSSDFTVRVNESVAPPGTAEFPWRTAREILGACTYGRERACTEFLEDTISLTHRFPGQLREFCSEGEGTWAEGPCATDAVMALCDRRLESGTVDYFYEGGEFDVATIQQSCAHRSHFRRSVPE